MITLEPVERPAAKPTSMLMMLDVVPTAASASLPTNCPTTMVSTVLYNCWKISPIIMGRENSINWRQMLPCVMSESRRLLFLAIFIPPIQPKRIKIPYHNPSGRSRKRQILIVRGKKAPKGLICGMSIAC